MGHMVGMGDLIYLGRDGNVSNWSARVMLLQKKYSWDRYIILIFKFSFFAFEIKKTEASESAL